MNGEVEIIELLAVVCILAQVFRRCRARWRRRRRLPSARRWLPRPGRRAATLQARNLAQAIIADRPDPCAHLAAGVNLQAGEDAWLTAPTRLAVRTGQASWEAYSRTSWLGRRSRNVVHGTATAAWRDQGRIHWLITSRRIVGRLPRGEMISVWWSGLAGVDIDLKRERIILNGVNGWIGILTGPPVAAIAVAAVTACSGLEALPVHPALERIWAQGPKPPAMLQQPEAVGTVAKIVPLQARRPPA